MIVIPKLGGSQIGHTTLNRAEGEKGTLPFSDNEGLINASR